MDEHLIRRVLERYMRANDDRSLEAILACFEETALYRVRGGEYHGHEAIRSFLATIGFQEGQPHWTEPGRLMDPPRMTHILSNPVIDIDGDEATAESDFTVVERDEEGHATFKLLGRYRDRLRRQADGTWLIAERTGVSLGRRNRFVAPA